MARRAENFFSRLQSGDTASTNGSVNWQQDNLRSAIRLQAYTLGLTAFQSAVQPFEQGTEMVADHRDRDYYFRELPEVRIVIEDYDHDERRGIDDTVSSLDLGCYLVLFGQIYESVRTLGSGVIDYNNWKDYRDYYSYNERSYDEFLENYSSRIVQIWNDLPRLNNNYTMTRLADNVLSRLESGSHRYKDDLLIRTISRNSPIEMLCYGLPWVLSVAVIFSGGSIKYNGFECRLPPIGHGIKSLRQALSQNQRSRPKLSRNQIKDQITRD